MGEARVIYLIGMTCVLFSLSQRSVNTNTWTMMDQRRDMVDADYLRFRFRMKKDTHTHTKIMTVPRNRCVTVEGVNVKWTVENFIPFLPKRCLIQS